LIVLVGFLGVVPVRILVVARTGVLGVVVARGRGVGVCGLVRGFLVGVAGVGVGLFLVGGAADDRDGQEQDREQDVFRRHRFPSPAGSTGQGLLKCWFVTRWF
jgi:hypothetical protein